MSELFGREDCHYVVEVHQTEGTSSFRRDFEYELSSVLEYHINSRTKVEPIYRDHSRDTAIKKIEESVAEC